MGKSPKTGRELEPETGNKGVQGFWNTVRGAYQTLRKWIQN